MRITHSILRKFGLNAVMLFRHRQMQFTRLDVDAVRGPKKTTHPNMEMRIPRPVERREIRSEKMIFRCNCCDSIRKDNQKMFICYECFSSPESACSGADAGQRIENQDIAEEIFDRLELYTVAEINKEEAIETIRAVLCSKSRGVPATAEIFDLLLEEMGKRLDHLESRKKAAVNDDDFELASLRRYQNEGFEKAIGVVARFKSKINRKTK